MIKLKELNLRNFRSWKELDLTENMLQGLVLFNGDNGNGKSAIRHAIEYLFFDTTMDALKLSEITSNKQGNCLIRGVFSIEDTIIEIEKYREHKEYNNTTILRVNGNSDSFTFTDRRETQKKIIEVFDIDLFEATSSSIFSKRSLSFPEATESKRKDVLYKIIDFSLYEKAYTESVKITKDLEKKISAKEDELTILDALLNSLAEDLKDLEFSKEETKKEVDIVLKDSKKRLKDLKNKPIKNIEDKIFSLEETLKITQDKNSNTILNKLKKEYKAIVKKSNKYEELVDNLSEELNECSKQYEMDRYILLKTEETLDKTKKAKCPILDIHCDTLLDSSSKEIEGLIEEIKKMKDSIEILSAKMEKIRSKRKSTNVEHSQVIEQITVIEDKIIEETNNAEAETLTLFSEIEELRTKIREIEDYNHSAELERTRLKNKIAVYSDKYSNLLKDVKSKKEKIVDLYVKKDKVVKEYKDLLYNKSVALISSEGFGTKGIPNMKIDTFLGALELKTNKMLSMLSDRLSVSIESQSVLESKEVREKISYKVQHPFKTIEDLHSYSSGQQHRVKVADMFAMNELIHKFDFMILDEVLGLSLDEKGKEATIQLLKIKAKELGFIAVIDHSQQLKESFNTVYNITLNNEVSCLSI